ncbi:MAG: M48 family metalloprotease [Comamonadaceae bacterium]|nr:M48 family metalloprotease [Comamonadaceae bacterium]
MTTPISCSNPAKPSCQRQKFKKKWLTALTLLVQATIIFVVFCSLLFNPALAQTAAGATEASVSGPGLPLLGDGSDMASNAERRLGDRIARELYHDPDYIDDPVLWDYVQGVWQPLLVAARQRGDLTAELDERFAWKILLGRDRTVNAFALPGGYLGLNLGLLAVVSSRDELASVLGHELSHVTQRHISRLVSKNNQQAPWMIGAMILGALAASKNAEAGKTLMVGGQALAAQSQLNFSRDMEREADRLGFGVMTQAGFEPIGFVTMFDKLQQASRLNDNGAYPYLRSHPLTTERIADMHSRLTLAAPRAIDKTPTALHAMMVARARVLSNPGVDALRGWQAQVDDLMLLTLPRAAQIGTLYGAAMAASRLRDTPLAQRHQQRLMTLVAPDAPMLQQVRWLGMEIGLAATDLPVGPSAAAQPVADEPLRRPALMLQAQMALKSGAPAALDKSAQNLQIWLAQQPQDALAWQWLSGVYGAQNQSLRALRAQAEVQVAQLDYAAALDRLKAAQDRVREGAGVGMGVGSSAAHIDASIIDTRRRQIEVLLREQTLDR